MAIPSRFIAIPQLISRRIRVQNRFFCTAFKHGYNNRSTESTILSRSRESHCSSTASKSRYGTSHSDTDDVLSTDVITNILAKYESYTYIGVNAVKCIETTQFPVNDPVEDMHAEGRLLINDGFLFGVFDGHGGEACSLYASECLLIYIANYLAKKDDVGCLITELNPDTNRPFYEGSIKWISSLPKNVVHEANNLFTENLHEIRSERSTSYNSDIKESIKAAFLRLDRDITNGPLIKTLSSQLRRNLIEPAFSGSCATVAYVTDRDLYVANTGDCRAVIGAINESGDITAKEITRDHIHKNVNEVKRLLDVRPEEYFTVLKYNRLLGKLFPLRAFGNVKFKWSLDDLKLFSDEPDVPVPNYHTPPYLTAEPEVFYHHLTKDDKFLVLATDGLWDQMHSQQVVTLIDQHIKRFKGASRDSAGTSLQDNDCSTFCDRNCATFLIRNALGLSNHRVSLHLTLPAEITREFGDDITVTIVYFDINY